MDSNKNVSFNKQGIKEPNDIIDADIDVSSEEKRQNIKNIESYRELKKNTQEFIKKYCLYVLNLQYS